MLRYGQNKSRRRHARTRKTFLKRLKKERDREKEREGNLAARPEVHRRSSNGLMETSLTWCWDEQGRRLSRRFTLRAAVCFDFVSSSDHPRNHNPGVSPNLVSFGVLTRRSNIPESFSRPDSETSALNILNTS